jgi:hypothetical protein
MSRPLLSKQKQFEKQMENYLARVKELQEFISIGIHKLSYNTLQGEIRIRLYKIYCYKHYIDSRRKI